jgi:hypothetical protein
MARRLPIPESVIGRLAGLTCLDLVWRVAAVTPTDTALSDIAIATVSLALGGTAWWPGLTQLTTWLLLGYAALSLAPVAYPDRIDAPVTDREFRLLFTATALGGAGLLLSVDIGPVVWASTHLVWVGLGLLAWLAGVGCVFLLWLRYRAGWTLAPHDERFARTIRRYQPVEVPKRRLESRWAITGWRGVVTRAMVRAIVAAVVAAPVVLAGGVVVILLRAYPLPDVLAVGGVLWIGITNRIDPRLTLTPKTVDFEYRLFDALSYSARSLNGLVLLTLLLATLWPFVGMLGQTLPLLPAFVRTVPGVVADDPTLLVAPIVVFHRVVTGSLQFAGRPVLVSALCGWLLLSVSGTAYATWAFVRELPRIGAFLRWRDGETVAVPPRPVGYVVPGALVIHALIAADILSLLAGDSLATTELWVVTAFAIGWPLGVVLLVGCWLLSLRRTVMPVVREDHLIIWTAAGLLIGMGLASTPIGIKQWLGVALSAVILGYLPDVIAYAARHDDHRQYATGAYLCLAAGGLGGVAVATDGAFPVVVPLGVFAAGLISFVLEVRPVVRANERVDDSQ